MRDHSDFHAAKLRTVRAFHGLTQSELSADIGYSQSMLGHVESGDKDPPTMMIRALAARLDVEPEFFFEEHVVDFKDNECHFRKRKKTPLSVRARMRSYGTLFASFVYYAETFISFPEVNIPEIRVEGDVDVERAAAHCRLKWSLDLDRPIDLMTRVIENAGGIVTRLNMDDKNVDAFSRFGDRPVVLLNATKHSTSRSRHDAAHELGHLVMHRDIVTGVDEADETEAQADLFASSFLFPRASFFREFPRTARISWDEVYALKRRWKVSAKSIVYRAHRHALISDAEYTRAMKSYSKQGWNSGEPEEPPPEDPELVFMSLEALGIEFGYTILSIAKKLYWKERLARRLIGAEVSPEPARPQQEGPWGYLRGLARKTSSDAVNRPTHGSADELQTRLISKPPSAPSSGTNVVPLKPRA